MRVAVCYSGHLRTFEHLAPKHRALFSSVNADFFLHSWNVLGHARSWAQGIDLSERIDVEQVQRWLNAAAIVLEDPAMLHLDLPTEWTPLRGHESLTPQRVMTQFYKMGQCDLLRQAHEARHGFGYDLVVRLRPDLEIGPIPFEECLQQLPEGTIGIPQDEHFTFEHQQRAGLLADKCTIARPATMSRLLRAFHFFSAYLARGVRLHPETLFAVHARRMGLRVIELPIKTQIKRRLTYVQIGGLGNWAARIATDDPTNRVYLVAATDEQYRLFEARWRDRRNLHLINAAAPDRSAALRELVDEQGIDDIESVYVDLRSNELEILAALAEKLPIVRHGVVDQRPGPNAAASPPSIASWFQGGPFVHADPAPFGVDGTLRWRFQRGKRRPAAAKPPQPATSTSP